MIRIDKPLRLATITVRGLSGRRKQYQLRRLLDDKDLDIIALQETKIESEEGTDRMVNLFTSRYLVCVSHACGRAGGCALLIRKTLGITIESVITDENGRLVVCDLLLCAMKWRVICLYAPNVISDRTSFFDILDGYLRVEGFIIMMGDFNCV